MSQTNAEDSGTACLRTIECIRQVGVIPSPQNYELFYQYITGANEELAAALGPLMDRDCGLHQSVLDRIYETHVAAHQVRAELANMGDRLGDQVGGTLALMREIANSNKEYGDSLSGTRFSLAELSDAKKIEIGFQSLVQLARNMERASREFDGQLKASSDKIEQLEKQLDELHAELRTDALTGSANRGFFDKMIDAQIARADRLGEQFCLCMIDVDYFKSFNDSHGHRAGDSALRLVAIAIEGELREYDVICRYGGDEFAVILPTTDLATATKVAERMRAALVGRPLLNRKNGETLGHITVTIGVSQFRAGDSEKTLIERADRCLYAAKEAGRNRVLADPGDNQSEPGKQAGEACAI